MEPKRFIEALDATALWDFVDQPAHAATPLKFRSDRAVYAASIPILPTTIPHPQNQPTTDPSTPDHEPIELPIIIKIFRRRGVGDTLQRLAGQSRAQREWHGLWKLRDAGIETPMPYALLRAKTHDGSPIELLIMQRVPGHDLLHCWAEGGLNGEAGRAILERVGTQIAALMRAPTPLFNRDHKPSNIIIDPDGVPTMIDAAGVRHWRFQRPVAMLAKLWIETLGAAALHPELRLPSRTQRWRVVRSYCQGALGGWAMATPVSRRAQTKAAWKAATRLIERHGDPTPQDDPLSSSSIPD